jgi:hypothetical protein
MAKEKEKIKKNKVEANVRPIGIALDRVVKDFKKHMKTTGVKLKELTYDQTLEKLQDHCQDLLADRARQARATDSQ